MDKRFLLPAVLCIVACIGSAFANDSAPGWLQNTPQQAIPHYDKDVTAVVLLNEETVTLNDKGLLIRHGRLAVKVLTKEGNKYAHQNIPYGGDSKVIDFVGWNVSPDGKVRKADKKDTIDVGYSESAYTNKRNAKVIDFSDAQPGSILGWEWENRKLLIDFRMNGISRTICCQFLMPTIP